MLIVQHVAPVILQGVALLAAYMKGDVKVITHKLKDYMQKTIFIF